jgi:DNA-cytosine methyltransferase
MEKGINVLSLFDGMSCGRIALDRAGIKVDKYYASEIDKYAMQVSKHNYPDTKYIGDVTKWEEWDIDWSKIDIVTGGFPCQSWSLAGKQLGDKDERGMLFWTMLEVIKKVLASNPRAKFLMENVKMKREFEDYITYHTEQALGEVFKYLINSSLVSAQNRVRLYWTNIPNVTEPDDRGIVWGDVRERGVNTESYYYTEKAMQWLARVSQKKNRTLTVHSDDDKMQMLEASHHKKYSNQRFFGILDLPENKQTVAAMRGRYLIDGKRQDGKQKTEGLTKQYIEFRYDGKTNALTTVTKDNVVVPFTLPNRVPADEFFFRYITPLECERLQTVPEGFTACVSNTQRYRMLGNGWTVDVIAHIFKNLKS